MTAIRRGRPSIWEYVSAVLGIGIAIALGGASPAVAQEGGAEEKPAGEGAAAPPAEAGKEEPAGKLKEEEAAGFEEPKHEPIRTTPGVRVVPDEGESAFKKNFRPDPTYDDKPYSADAQLAIYGGKYNVRNQRPLLELGRSLYTEGNLERPDLTLGSTNPVTQHLWIFGDWRVIGAYNDFGGGGAKKDQTVLATKLTLDFDYQFTSTERIHAQFTPLDFNGKFTRYDIAGDNDDQVFAVLDPNPDTLFLEGDIGAIIGGIKGKPSTSDLPFAIGRIPLLFHNGIWVNDAFDGVAFTPINAKNSVPLDITNMDVTLFAGVNDVNTAAVKEKDDAIFGAMNAFIEVHGSYFEIGYGYVGDQSGDDLSYSNFAVSWSRRHFNFISNSVRVFGSVGQDPDSAIEDKGRFNHTADGFGILVENSFNTGEAQQALVPYFNMFAGFGKPQPLARAAGGLLTNTGINFETDGITGFPNLDDTANNTYGAALGVEYLFDLSKQLVFEVATARVMFENDSRKLQDDEYAVGVRYQHPITNAMILRLDAMYGWREDDDDIAGVRVEYRFKF
ncbi:MAG: hypothetical protein HYZ53_20080 [Planctomycetes bacterium]|nr:hypothetical protein [Planctomycetota bacterium]